MPFPSGQRARALLARTLDVAGRQSLLLHRRRRGHAAVLVALTAISVFGFQLLERRTVRVLADGREVVVQTRMSKDAAVLRGAQVELRPGDRVTALESGSGLVLQVERARRVELRVDGMSYELRTHAQTIAQVLEEADVALTGRDSVLQNGALVSANGPVEPPRLLAAPGAASSSIGAVIAIEVRRAVAYSVVEDGIELPESTSSRPTVAQALREAGVQIRPGDLVTPDPLAPLDADTRIEIRHARAVTITLPGDHRVIYTHALTVGEVLTAEGITLPEGAFIDPPAETPVTDQMSVRVVQLSAGSDIEREYIESGTVYRSDPSLGPGSVRTEEGHDGVRVRRYEVSYVNGEEAGRTLVEEYYETEPVETVIYYPVRQGRDEAAPAEGSVVRTINVYATYYTPESAGRPATDPAYGHTATGAIVTYGIVAVDPNVIPLGTRMFIPGYGYAVAADTGGAVKGYIIDLGFPDGVAVDWRPRWLDIYILS